MSGHGGNKAEVSFSWEVGEEFVEISYPHSEVSKVLLEVCLETRLIMEVRLEVRAETEVRLEVSKALWEVHLEVSRALWEVRLEEVQNRRMKTRGVRLMALKGLKRRRKFLCLMDVARPNPLWTL